MSTDWDSAAVAKVVSERIAELGVKQKAAAERAGISTATLRAIQLNYGEHRPEPETLSRLSAALGFAPGHLQSVGERLQQLTADGIPHNPQQPETENVAPEFNRNTLVGHLSKLDRIETIEKRLTAVATTVDKIDRKLDRITVDIQHLPRGDQA